MVLESDEYIDSASDYSSGEEYVPTAEDLEEMEPPILPSSRRGSGVSARSYPSSPPPPPSLHLPSDDDGDDEDEDDPLSFLYSLGLQKRGKKRELDGEVCGDEATTLPMPRLPSPTLPPVSPLKNASKIYQEQRASKENGNDEEIKYTARPVSTSHRRRLYGQEMPHHDFLLHDSTSPEPGPSCLPDMSPAPASPQPGPSRLPDVSPAPASPQSGPFSCPPQPLHILRQQQGRVISRGRATRGRKSKVTLVRTPPGEAVTRGSSQARSQSRSRQLRRSRGRTLPLSANTRTAEPNRESAERHEGQNTDQAWNWRDGTHYQPNNFNFQGVRDAGPNIPGAHRHMTRLDVFIQFFTANLLSMIADQTNWYNYYYMAGKVQAKNSARLTWTDVDIGEMYVFIAIVLLMGMIKKSSIRKYWACDPLLVTPIFGRLMSRNRFTAIMGNLHFTDSLQSHLDSQHGVHKDTMERIRPVLEYLKAKFTAAFRPYQKMIIDESLVLWRGNISIRQYIPSKRHRYGLKLFVLCDCLTGYIQDMILYMGKKTELVPETQYGVSGAVVITMMQRYLNKGHILYLDNWYSSPSLALYLHDHGTGMCGTVRRNRSYMPELPSRRLADSIVYLEANNILLLSWMDNRDVNILTTIHQPTMVDSRRRDRATGEIRKKPVAVEDYNINMRLVDKSDAVISSVECARRTMRWYKKMFFHLLDMTVYNCHILYSHITGVKETMEDFTIELARDLLMKNLAKERIPQQRPHPSLAKERQGATGVGAPPRLVERHFSRFIPPNPTKKNPSRRCHVCANTTRREQRRKDTRSYCQECDVGLCYDQCFIDYHTLLHF